MKYLTFLLLLPPIALKSGDHPNIEKQIIGVWIQVGYQNETYTYKRAEKFEKDAPGIEFRENGKLIKRQNVGWCGTPPISYGNDEGTWSGTGQNGLVSVNYHFWGGTVDATWEIVKIDKQTMEVRVSSFETEK